MHITPHLYSDGSQTQGLVSAKQALWQMSYTNIPQGELDLEPCPASERNWAFSHCKVIESALTSSFLSDQGKKSKNKGS